MGKKDWDQEVSARNGAWDKSEGQPVADAGTWEPAVQKIIGFQQLGEDWDGLGAKAPSRELLESAIGLAYLLSEKGTEPPSRVVPGLTGTVIFEWQFADGTYGEIEIERPFYAEVMMIEPGKPSKHCTIPIGPGVINIV